MYKCCFNLLLKNTVTKLYVKGGEGVIYSVKKA